jgi:galactokinase
VIRAYAPGRVNLIGDHTDYTGGLVLPMAIDLGTTVTGERGGDAVRLASASAAGEVLLPLDPGDPAGVRPAWGRHVAGVLAVLRPAAGFTGLVSSTLPVGAGLSSSAALGVAVALALGFSGPQRELAQACQRAEQLATGVPCGVMDQMTAAAGVAGHALQMDCSTLEITGVPVPDDTEVVVVHSGQSRELAGSEYAARRAECVAAEEIIGPLRSAGPRDVDRLDDPVLRARARHVITENARVREFASALAAGDLPACGELMVASHRSLAGDFGVSTPQLDGLVRSLLSRPGVYGARLTGAGFGGCVVALTTPAADIAGWHVRPSGGAWVR